MPDWRDRILKALTPGVARLTVAADPDGLLLEAAIFDAIRKRGFEIVTFEDPVAFRFDYESRFRSRWDRGEGTGLELVVRTDSRDLAALPCDLLQAGRRLSFGLDDLFPAFSHPVVASLDRSDLDALYQAQERHRLDRLGDDATRDFVLRHVFGFTPELVRRPSDLLSFLLRRHYRVQRPARGGGTPGLAIGGPADLPFDHDDVRVYIDNLFVEGMLRPVCHESGHVLRSEWAAVGVRIDPEADRCHRLRRLAETVGATIPGTDANHRDWTTFAFRWAELGVLLSETAAAAQADPGSLIVGPRATRADTGSSIAGLRADVDRAFLAWVERRYAGLHNQPPAPPVMVHHLPRFLARRLADDPRCKAALLVVDGLALDQWLVLRDALAIQRPGLRFREGAAFAWAPTITSVSRQASFAGKPPFYFPSSLLTTDREASLWAQFWADQGLAAQEAGYARGLGDGLPDGIRELLLRPKIRALGLVVDKVDKIMHGMELGTAGMHNQVRQWAEEGFMAGLLDALLDGGFAVFLTSDHGNVEAEGCGRPAEGAIADVRGERARIYPDAVLRSRVKERFPDAIERPGPGLPEDCLALLAPGRTAFVREGERIVGHGGVSLEEVVVPMVEIERAAA